MAQGIKWPFITSNNHGKNAANLFLAKTASASKIANMTVLVGSFGWFCNMVKDVSIRGRVCEDMMAKNRLCIPGPFGEMWVVPCALGRVWRLHRLSPRSTTRNKTAGIPHHGNGTMAPWGFACLANKSMSSSNQALPRFIWKPAMQMLQRCPFPKPSLSWFLGGWDGALSCFRCGEVKRSKKTCYPIPAQAWSWQPAWEAWVAISKEAISKVSCDLPRVVNKWCNFFGTSHFLFISKSLRITFISIAVNKVGGLDAPSLWFNSFQFLCTPTHVPRMFSVALVPIQFLFVSHMFVAIAYSFPVVFFWSKGHVYRWFLQTVAWLMECNEATGSEAERSKVKRKPAWNESDVRLHDVQWKQMKWTERKHNQKQPANTNT